MPVLAAAALVASACGGSKPASSAAEVAPRSTYALVSGDADALDPALDLVPEGPRLDALLERARALTGAGPAAQIAVLDASGSRAVAFTQPADRKRFDKSLDTAGLAHARIRGWTVFSRQHAAVDVVRRAKRHLAELPWFDRPVERATATFVVRGLTLTASAERGRVVARRTTAGGGHDAPHPLASLVPKDAVAAAALHEGRRLFPSLPIAAALERAVGLRPSDLARVAPADAVLFLRRGEPIPTITLIASGTQKAAAVRLARRLYAGAAPAVPATVDGVALDVLSFGALDVYYGTFDGKVVLTTDATAKLHPAASPLEPAGAPEASAFWLSIDTRRGLPALAQLAALGGTRLSPRFAARLRRTRNVTAYVTRRARTQTLVVSVEPR